MSLKPSIPKGTRDFSPQEMIRRQHILRTIRTVYEQHGYLPLETPAMENLEALEGKYGDEGDKLLFRVLNSGPFPPVTDGPLRLKDVTEKGLRYDLTVPFARYVVMHRNDITFPFKRYQVQPVWRADRPQKGRYREFVQCDADVIGSDSLLNEVEMVQMIGEAFGRLGLSVTLRLNNRKILDGLAARLGGPFADLTVAMDKLDKAGPQKVRDELSGKGFSDDALDLLDRLITDAGPWRDRLDTLRGELAANEAGLAGIGEMEAVLGLAEVSGTTSFRFDLSLARGLSYYTGTIFEVRVDEPASTFAGSLLGGGRYDDLTGIFGLPGISGVGISFGIDRIYDVLMELKRFDDFDRTMPATQVLFVNFGEAEAGRCLELATGLRREGIRTEVYPDTAKMKKQLGYADTHRIPWVVLIGSEELKSGKVTVKNMRTGEQSTTEMHSLISSVKEEK